MRLRTLSVLAMVVGMGLAMAAGPGRALAAQTPSQAAINETLALIQDNKPEQALQAARKAITVEPGRVEAHLLYIRLMTELGRRAEVQAEYSKRLEQKKDALSQVLYGRTLEKPDQMEAAFRKALTLDPKLGWAYYCIASVQVQQNQVDKATKSLEQAIQVQPAFTQAMQSLGSLYLGQGKLDEAIATYRKSVALDPEDAQTLFELGSLLGKRGQSQEAISLLERSSKLAPENLQVMNNLAFMYLKVKRYDDAIALYDKVLKLDSGNASARLNREIVRRVKKGDVKYEAITAMEKAMDASTPQDAIAQYRRVIEMSPNFELPYLALGQLLAATGKADDAEKAFVRAVELNPASVEAVRMLSEFYLVAGQPKKAEPYLKKAIGLSPKAPELYAAMGMVYLNTNEPVKAEQSFVQASRLLPPELAVATRANAARAIMLQGRLADAASELRSVLKVAPGFAQARVELGLCYYAMEEFDRALAEYRVAQKANPDNKELKTLIKAVEDKKAAYKEKSKDHMRARQIVVKTQPEAEGLLKQLKGGANFEMLARTKSTSPDAKDGGDVGFFKKGELMPEFEKAVASLKVGEISGIVKTSAGYHIIKRLN